MRPCCPTLCGKADAGVRHLDCKQLQVEFDDRLQDEYTHAAFWKHVNFEDPCSPEEQSQFKLCGQRCASRDHEKVLRPPARLQGAQNWQQY